MADSAQIGASLDTLVGAPGGGGWCPMKRRTLVKMRRLAGPFVGLSVTCELCALLHNPGVGLGAEGPALAQATTNAPSPQVAHFQGIGEPCPASWMVMPSSSGDGACAFTVEVKGISAVAGPEGYELHIPGEATSAAPGTPAIPRIAKLFPGMRGRTAVLTVTGFSPTEVTNIPVVAAEAYAVDNPERTTRSPRSLRRRAPDIYAQDRFWPPEVGRVQEAWIGTQKVVRVEVFPVQYNPQRETVRFYRRLEGVVSFEPVGQAVSP